MSITDKKVTASIYKPNLDTAKMYLRSIQIGQEIHIADILKVWDSLSEGDQLSQRQNERAYVTDERGRAVAFFGGAFADEIIRVLTDEEERGTFRVFAAEPTEKQKPGSIRLRIVGGEDVTADELNRYLADPAEWKRAAAAAKRAQRTERKGYTRAQAGDIYRRYAEMKNWRADAKTVKEKVAPWIEQGIGPVGLAIQWRETGIDPKPELSRSTPPRSQGSPAAVSSRPPQAASRKSGCLGVVVVVLVFVVVSVVMVGMLGPIH